MSETAVSHLNSLLAARLRLHLSILPTSVGLSVLLGAVVTAARWDNIAHGLLLAWAGALALVLALRAGVGFAYHRHNQSHQKPSNGADTRWLLRHHLSFFAHGMVWGIGGLVLQGPADISQFSLLTIGIVAIAAGSLNSTTFDLKASLAFVMAALVPMLVVVFMQSSRVATIGGLIMITFMIATFIGARRAEHIFVEAESLRLAESQRADEARRSAEQAELARSELAEQNRLLSEAEAALKTYELVANSITDMVSVIGEDFQYRMVNDAWCKLLGVSREQALNRKTSDVLSRSVSTDERRAALRLCAEEQKVRVLRGQINFPDGVARHIETTYYPYMDAEAAQNVRCVVMVSRDVTQAEMARQQLAESAEYLQRTLNATGDAIFASESTSFDEPVRFVNEQMLEMWGIPRNKLATLTPRDIMAYAVPLFAEPETESLRIAEIIAANSQHESQLWLTDGRVMLRRCIPAQIGERTLRVWSFRDITERKLAEQQLAASNAQLQQKSQELQRSLDSIGESEAESRALLDAFPGYIVALDRRFHYTYANAAIAHFLQKTPSEMIGSHVRDVAGEARFQVVAEEVQMAKDGQRLVRTRHYPATAQRPVLDMEITHVVGRVKADGSQTIYLFGIDITARVQAEQALIAARDAAETASRAKSDFLSSMTHELRTPMNAILGFGQLLELGHQSDADRQDWGREVVKGGRHLLELINEVLDLARVESGKMTVNLEPLALQPLIDDCLMLVSPQARTRNIELIAPKLAKELVVETDRIRLKQIMLNLLSNAVKFNALGGTVTITCAAALNRARISIADTGKGLSPEQLERLFQPFERLNADHERIEGSGIGLVLTRRLVELIDADMGVESEPGKGCVFWVSLPMAVAR